MKSSWTVKNTVIDCDRTTVMGILNVTPDSFSDGGRYLNTARAVECALTMQEEGADIIDIGGQSTRPGSLPLPAEEELSRIEPVISALSGRLKVPLSVDTYYPEVAQRALQLGASIVNDVSGRANPAMAAVVAASGAGWILTETLGSYQADVAGDVCGRLGRLAEEALHLGVAREHICLDPGFGFEKDAAQNTALLAGLDRVASLGYPLLAAASRKRFIGALTGVEQPDLRDPGSLAVHLLCLQKGANMIRVHNVSMSVQMARVWDALRGKL